MRSHPPTLIKIAERTLAEECALVRGERILVAVSGGGDSMALLDVLARLTERFGVALVAHGVDHGLRAEAAAELDLAASVSARLNIEFARTRVDVGRGGNLQARARAARREALLRAAALSGATRIATAHHADDRAETVLIRLLHGAGVSALGVLPPVDGPLLRPLIRASKVDILRHLERHAIPWAADPSNEDLRFLRVRVRREALPLLTELSPAIVSHLNALADEARDPTMPELTIPELRDESGSPVRLRRAHVQALRRALGLGIRARIRLSGDRELVVDPRQPPGRAVRVDAGRREAAPRPSRQKGDAKSEKRG